MAYVTVVIQSRLSSMDESVEEAALDLGARPAKVFFVITLPINALATIIVLIVATGIVAAGIVMNRAERRRQRDVQMAIAANQ
jgi:putrescine transport system permease protein